MKEKQTKQRKIGIKIFPNGKAFLKQIEQYVDFVEIMAVEGAEYPFLKNWKKEIVIHQEHGEFGVNHANPKKRKKNQAATKWAIHLADKYNAKKIIVHGGHIENKECSIKEIIKQLSPVWDKRIIFENLIAVANGQYMFCYNKEQLKILTKKFNTGICLDISHAVLSGMERYEDPEYILKELKTLPIMHGHMCNGHEEKPVDQHLHFCDGNFPLRKYIKYFPKEVAITIETQKNTEKAKQDIRFVKKYG